MGGERVADAPVEALGHAVGLGAIGAGQLMGDAVAGADAIEGVAAGAGGAALVEGAAEAIGELGSIAHWERSVREPPGPDGDKAAKRPQASSGQAMAGQQVSKVRLSRQHLGG